MTTIVTRTETQTDGTAAKGSELTWSEVDTNFINLNDNKVEVSGAIIFSAKAGEALSKGDVVYVSGVSGNEPVVSKADADVASKMPAYGLAEDDANLNAAVNIVTFGTLYDLDTSAFSAGDTVYVSTTAGGLTNSAPTGESSLIQNLGMVIRSHASAGSIKVGGAGRTNATPNLNNGNVFIGNASNQAAARALVEADISDFGTYLTSVALDDVTDVTLTTPTNGQVLKYNGSAWVNAADSDSGTVTSVAMTVPTGLSVSGTPITTSGTLAVTFTAGYSIPTDANQTNWTTAYGWGDHSAAGYLTSVALNGVSDVTITTPADNEVLAYDSTSSQWINQTPAEAGLATSAQGALADSALQDVVDDTTPQLGGDLDVNGFAIKTAATGNLVLQAADVLQAKFNNGANTALYANSISGKVAIGSATTGSSAITLDGSTEVTGAFTSTGIDDNASSTAITIDSSQNVGIGIAPGTDLDVYRSTTTASTIRARNDSVSVYMEANNGYSYLNTYSNHPMLFGTNNAERMRIDSGGNVGIGDSTPANRLQVTAGGVNNSPTLGSINSNAQLYLTNSDTAYGLVVGNSAADGHVWMQAQRTDGTATAYNITLNEAGGNVGIGDGAISATLDVHSTTASSEISVEGSGGKWATLLSGTGATGPALCFDNTSSRFRITSSANKLGTSQTEHFIVEPSGDVGIGVVPGATRLHSRGSTANSTAYSIYCDNSAGTQLFFARNDGLIGTGATTNSPYNLTTASSANLHVASTGLLYRSTSSARYKRNIQDMSYGVADVMNLRSVTFEQNNEYPSKTYAGFIAEEVHDAGLVEFVEYNEAGQPDAVHYGNMVSLLTKAIQDQQATIASLTARIEQLEAN